MQHIHAVGLCWTCVRAARRAAEEELCALGDERDRLAPQVFWRTQKCCMPTHSVHHGTAALSCCSQGGRGGAWRAWGDRLALRIWCDGIAAWQRALWLVAKAGRACRAAEEELCAIGDERDRLAPQVEEARWHARRAEKDAAAARAERDALQTARPPALMSTYASDTVHRAKKDTAAACAERDASRMARSALRSRAPDTPLQKMVRSYVLV